MSHMLDGLREAIMFFPLRVAVDVAKHFAVLLELLHGGLLFRAH